MLEWAASGILGNLFGGLFRLAPEIIKFFDKKNERNHEYRMFDLQTQLEKVKGDYRMEEKYVDYSIANLGAIQSAFNEQSETASKSYKWVAALSALVRPIVTYVLFGLYIAVKFVFIGAALSSGDPWTAALAANWTVDDFAMLNAILMFWFVGRSIDRYNRK